MKRNKMDYWPTAVAMMVSAMAVIAIVDIAVSWFGTGVFARIFG